MCTYQINVPTIGCWLQDPMIRLAMDSDHVSDAEMRALLERISVAVAARPPVRATSVAMRG